MSLKLAVLASGSGTNFQAMVDAVRRGALDADIRLVICNRPGAKVIERAKAAGIICAVMDHKLWPSREAYDLAVADAILKSGADTVALAGYMRMLTAGFLNAFPHRVVNVHPALLPSFPGIHGAADAQAWGVKITGCTVHLVDEIMDHGEVIIQAAVPAHRGRAARRSPEPYPRAGTPHLSAGAPVACRGPDQDGRRRALPASPARLPPSRRSRSRHARQPAA